MAQAKKKTATRTTKKTVAKRQAKKGFCYEKYDKNQSCNMIFVISMSFLAATLLFANLLLMNA